MVEGGYPLLRCTVAQEGRGISNQNLPFFCPLFHSPTIHTCTKSLTEGGEGNCVCVHTLHLRRARVPHTKHHGAHLRRAEGDVLLCEGMGDTVCF